MIKPILIREIEDNIEIQNINSKKGKNNKVKSKSLNIEESPAQIPLILSKTNFDIQ